MLEELKAWAVDQHLGEEKMLEMSLQEIAEHFRKAEENIKKAEKRAVMLEEAVADLGKEAFDNLSDEEKEIFRLFIWAGCGCHKDLNTV